MGDRFAPGEQVRVDTRYGESFYGTYVRWRPQNVWEHMVKVVVFRLPTIVVRLGDEVRCTDKEVEACAFVTNPPTSIQDIERFLN